MVEPGLVVDVVVDPGSVVRRRRRRGRRRGRDGRRGGGRRRRRRGGGRCGGRGRRRRRCEPEHEVDVGHVTVGGVGGPTARADDLVAGRRNHLHGVGGGSHAVESVVPVIAAEDDVVDERTIGVEQPHLRSRGRQTARVERDGARDVPDQDRRPELEARDAREHGVGQRDRRDRHRRAEPAGRTLRVRPGAGERGRRRVPGRHVGVCRAPAARRAWCRRRAVVERPLEAQLGRRQRATGPGRLDEHLIGIDVAEVEAPRVGRRRTVERDRRGRRQTARGRSGAEVVRTLRRPEDGSVRGGCVEERRDRRRRSASVGRPRAAAEAERSELQRPVHGGGRSADLPDAVRAVCVRDRGRQQRAERHCACNRTERQWPPHRPGNLVVAQRVCQESWMASYIEVRRARARSTYSPEAGNTVEGAVCAGGLRL